MKIHWSTEVKQLLNNEAPDLQIRDMRAIRGEPSAALELVYQAIVFGSSIGAFGGLWKVCELIVKRFGSCRVKISYKASDGANVEVEYPQCTAVEAAAITAKHPLASPHEVVIAVLSPLNKRS